MPVPLLDVNAQNHPLAAELTAAFQRVLSHGMFIMGTEVEQLETEMREFLGVQHALAVSSGTDALLLALMALDVGPCDEVLCPSFTFFATGGCVARLGAVPVFVDVDAGTFNIDVADAEAKITSATKAIMPVHLFGQSADMGGVLALAERHGLKVLEDAAQSLGAKQRGAQTGTLGHFGAYSFFPSKNLGALGDAGLLVTNDPDLARRAKILRVHGMEPKYYHQEVGANFRLDALQCAFLSVKLKHYAHYTRARQQNAEFYTSRFSGLSEAQVILPSAEAHNEHIWNQYTLRVLGGRRDDLRRHLASAGVGCEVYYPLTLDQQQCFADLPEHARRACPIAHELASQVLSLPVYPELSAAQRDEVVAAVLSFFS